MNFNGAEDTFFKVKKSLNFRGRILDLSTPAIMGIINLTPDSFYDGGKFSAENRLLAGVEAMIAEGADIIDIGGQSTRPGAKRVSKDEEWKRIQPALEIIASRFPEVIISVDTFYAEVAEKAVEAGASMVNDISAGEYDPTMFSFVSERKIPYILMHKKGDPENMQEKPEYENVVTEVFSYFIAKVNKLKKLGAADLVIDPGFGFGKTLHHNFTLLRNLPLFKFLELPVLAGVSRKSMVTKVLNVKPDEALTGTIALHTLALHNGANILRVHDVEEAVQVKKIIKQYVLTEGDSLYQP